ncbi:GNAT family N-acetyltransferase [Anaerocolumna xylanovorans]|uniref:Haloacid dehalogenase superfamily, subfamily IA, variant 3 with third motif having DD or ED n=1 Tax=Anaerocolumna xylanovorans DSM 12503 TaxID=1121345 RepID=A0A1M7YJ23_9FIRM|nr:GNAT family N-acetyltransferase [Anaerocolumna xylanovorans]SHO52612.1 haloacid dehalogenase superfamily, subfamily IA, variant 3 with third motif having DD or ED [Anaerocolumna xylanovorans DSM 12503]
MLKGIIFDMDGVIIDSEPTHAKAAVNTLETLGVSLTLDYPYRFIGSTTEYMLKTMIQDFNLSITIDSLHELYKKALAKLIKEEGYIPIPHVITLIKHLHQKGYALAIASSSTPEEITAVTQALQISSCFSKLVSGATVLHPKPAPDVFIKAVSELNLKAEECIIIEDSCNGVKAACAAAIPVIGYLNPNSGNQDLSQAAILIEGFDEIDAAFLEKAYNRYHNFPVVIAETKRLVIREMSVDDIPALMNIYKNPAVNSFLPQIYKASLDSLDTAIDKHKAYIKNMYHFYEFGLWGVYLKTGRLIGQCGIEPAHIDGEDSIEIGYLIDSKYQDLGYGKEAIEAVLNYSLNCLDIGKITALISPQNISSIEAIKKAGFLYEKNITRDGDMYQKYNHSFL